MFLNWRIKKSFQKEKQNRCLSINSNKIYIKPGNSDKVVLSQLFYKKIIKIDEKVSENFFEVLRVESSMFNTIQSNSLLYKVVTILNWTGQ